jgi:hypothetical protein
MVHLTSCSSLKVSKSLTPNDNDILDCKRRLKRSIKEKDREVSCL